MTKISTRLSLEEGQIRSLISLALDFLWGYNWLFVLSCEAEADRGWGGSTFAPPPWAAQGRATPPPPEQITIFLFLISFKITYYEEDGN